VELDSPTDAVVASGAIGVPFSRCEGAASLISESFVFALSDESCSALAGVVAINSNNKFVAAQAKTELFGKFKDFDRLIIC
jgi:hypothetical protein